jgi:hypothetical protein
MQAHTFMNSQSQESIISLLNPDQSIAIAMSGLQKGIDNYHIDILLSRKFSSDAKKVISLLVQQIAVSQPKQWDNSSQFERLRDIYLDMMTRLIHRVKTDLSIDQIAFLQFAAVKHVIQVTNASLDLDISRLSAKLSELKNNGSSEALGVDEKLFWLKKNRDAIIYKINKIIFSQLAKVEDKQLAPIRKQFLGDDHALITELLLNPLLASPDLGQLSLLIDEFSIWSLNGEDGGFTRFDQIVCTTLNRYLPFINVSPIKVESSASIATEIHDELHGFFKLLNLTGLSQDSKSQLHETLNWFDQPDNIHALFAWNAVTNWLKNIRKQQGFLAWWKSRQPVKAIDLALKKLIKALQKDSLIPQLVASAAISRSVSPLVLDQLGPKLINQFLAGKITADKLQDSVASNKKISTEHIKSLEQLKIKLDEKTKKFNRNDVVTLLVAIARYRKSLKHYRLAHRVFNRMTILTEEDHIRLSKSAGSLYQMPVGAEVEDTEEKICHHVILKADVRGSTTVTDELINKDLNPASYFSMRFFNPINDILKTYGANKVFIEGDAIILSFLEYEHAPQEWFSVARACGCAKEMLKITNANNRHSKQMSLPLLELGVGICYSGGAPRFLYDGEQPIMISGAIGLADRLSGCSWKLRAALGKSLFNIAVYSITDTDAELSEKGQRTIRYNVNGITIDDLAYEKLRAEVALRSKSLKINGTEYLFHVGQYPDSNGRKKDIVIREGKVGLWDNDSVVPVQGKSEPYYEVVVNQKVIPSILEAFAKTAATN